MGKLRYRRLGNFLQGDRARKQHSMNDNPHSLASEYDPLSISASASLGKGDIEVGETLKVSSRAKRVLSINADFVLCISRT